MVESAEQLHAAIEEWKNCSVIGIDTEFVRERTYRADLGLIQFSDGQRIWLLDPLKTGPIESLAAFFEDPAIIKILHAPSEDLDVLLYTTTACPEPLFDTQIACAMLGQSLQLGYHKTVEWLLDITIDKGETRSNWLKRPLRTAQLHYAALDVCLLPMMHHELHKRLQTLDRVDWLQEDCERLISKAKMPLDPSQTWQRIAGNQRLDPIALAVLQQLAEWREHTADSRNLARGFVVKDTALLTIANGQPANTAELAALDVLHPRVLERNSSRLLAIVAKVLDSGLQAELPDSLDSRQRKVLADMRQQVQQKATELSVEPALLASRRELENLIFSANKGALPERFLGWRQDIITNDLLITMEKGS